MTRRGTAITVEDAVARVKEQIRRRRLRTFLDELTSAGCRIEVPPAERDDYLNVYPPDAHETGRLCSFNRSSARIMFETPHDVATTLGVGSRLESAGTKAALYPDSDDVVDAALRLARHVLATRRGRG